MNLINTVRNRSLVFSLVFIGVMLLAAFQGDGVSVLDALGAFRDSGGLQARDRVYLFMGLAAVSALGAVVYELCYEFQLFYGARDLWAGILGEGEDNVSKDDLKKQTSTYFYILIGVYVFLLIVLFMMMRTSIAPNLRLFAMAVFFYFFTNAFSDWLHSSKEWAAYEEFLETAKELAPTTEQVKKAYDDIKENWKDKICELVLESASCAFGNVAGII